MAGLPVDKVTMVRQKLREATEAIELAERTTPKRAGEVTLEVALLSVRACQAVFADIREASFEAKDAVPLLERAIFVLHHFAGESVVTARRLIQEAIVALQPHLEV